jgi:hypothetical protein
MVSATMMSRAGNNKKSRYGVKALKPTAPRAMTSIGVKQHSETSTVPASAVNTLFFEVCSDGFTIRIVHDYYDSDTLTGLLYGDTKSGGLKRLNIRAASRTAICKLPINNNCRYRFDAETLGPA